MILKPSPISSRQFHWHREQGLFTAEASDLGEFRIYND